MRLDRLITRHTGKPRKEVLRLLAEGAVKVAGEIEKNTRCEVDRFTPVTVGAETLPHESAVYLMLHKPAGILSATEDTEHRTVIDLISHPRGKELHLAGRLDRASTGLLLLTNNGRWSKRITQPESGIPKTYLVTTAKDITQETTDKFAEGIYFAFEDLTTQPAQLELLSPRQARLTIHEGRYHQVKRMFGALGNRVTALHREAIGSLRLDPDLAEGEWRELTGKEVELFVERHS